MPSRFNDNQILIQKKSVPTLPATSNELVLFFDGTELRTVDYSGKVSNFKQQVVEQIRVEADEETKRKVEQLVNDLNTISVSIFEELKLNSKINSNEVIVLKNLISLELEKVNNNLQILETTSSELEVAYETISKELIKAQISSSELEDKLLGVERDLQNKIDEASYEELKSLVRVDLSAFDERLGRVTGELLSKFTLLSSLLSSFVTREELDQVKLLIKPQKRVVSGSRNVRVQETPTSFIISVDIPQQEQSSKSGGLTRSRVQQLIDSTLADISGFGGTIITSEDNTIKVTPIDGGYDLSTNVIVPLEITSFSPASNYEKGQVINNVTFTWAYNEGNLSPDTSQSINNGIGSLPLVDRSYLYSNPLIDTTTFTLSAIDSIRGSASRNTTISFLWRVFWGVTTSSLLDKTEIITGSSALTNTRTRDITYDATGGRYFWYAYPAALSDLSTVNTKINGLTFSDWSDGSGGANVSGYTVLVDTVYLNDEPYKVYRSFNLQNGSEINLEYR